jgi:outer membrane protein assembly factor BamA
VTTNKWPPDVTLFGEISEKNFLGRELQLSGKVDLSIYKQGFNVSFDDPWFYNFPWSLGASVKFYHEWDQKVLKKMSAEDYKRYYDLGGDNSSPTEDDIRNFFTEYANNDDQKNYNYLGANGDNTWAQMGVHDLNIETSLRSGYRFLRYFSVSGELSLSPIYTFIPTDTNGIPYSDVYDVFYSSYRDQILQGWSFKGKISTTFGINTTLQRINPYEGLRFSLTTGYTFGHYDSVSLTTKFTYYWKILDIYFNDWAFKNVVVFNTAASFIFPGFRNLGGELNGINTQNRGPIMFSSDYLTVDGFFVGRGWSNSLGATSYEGRLTDKKGYARFDFSIEYRIPIHEKFIWLAAFVDMVNLIQGPTRQVPYLDPKTGTPQTVNGVQLARTDDSLAWRWWDQYRGNPDPSIRYYNSNMLDWYSMENWYGSIGVGFQLTLPQLPLSFYIVKRFKINQYSGFEWVNSSPGTANLDFVLSIVGFYF